MDKRSIKVMERRLGILTKGGGERVLIARVAYHKRSGYQLEVDVVTRSECAGYETDTYAMFSGVRRTLEKASRFNARTLEKWALLTQIKPTHPLLIGVVSDLEAAEVMRWQGRDTIRGGDDQ